MKLMKKSNLITRRIFVWSAIAVICATGAVKVNAQAAIGQLSEMTPADAAARLLQPVDPQSNATLAKDLSQNGIEPPSTTITILNLGGGSQTYPINVVTPPAPGTAATPQKETVKVAASSPVAFCTSGNFYDKRTGLCKDGKSPYKIVPLNSLADPAAKTPNVICKAPMVPTFNPASKTWQCIVPAGFKLNLGQ
jgi:hypothetical protein